MDYSGSGKIQSAASCERSNELCGSVKGVEFLDKLNVLWTVIHVVSFVKEINLDLGINHVNTIRLIHGYCTYIIPEN